MGFFDKIKSAAKKAKCKTGFHAGVFSTPEGSPACYFEKTCPDCSKLVTKFKHSYPKSWEEAPYDHSSGVGCTRIQKCDHCNEIEKRVVHESYRKLGVNGRCEKIIACRRCGHEKKDGYEHNFVREGSDENGNIIMKCLKCNHTEKQRYM